MNGTKDRKHRILSPRGGVWGSSSQDLVRLSNLLFQQSKSYAEEFDGNVSIYALAGIPVLFSALRALLLEANTGMYGKKGDDEQLEILVNSNEVSFLRNHYDIDGELLDRLKVAYEIRNEIAHPSHMPSGTESGTPEYLSVLNELDLLQEGIWLSQLQSHKLYTWIAEIFESVVKKLLSEHYLDTDSLNEHLKSWSRYREA